MSNRTRALTYALTAGVALGACVLSYVAIARTAAQLGAVDASVAWIVPLVLDGAVAVGVLNTASTGSRLARALTGVLLGLSLVVNSWHAWGGGASGVGQVLAVVIAGAPPAVLWACVELLRTPQSSGSRAPRAASPRAERTPPAVASVVPHPRLAPVPAAGGSLRDRVKPLLDAHVAAGGDPGERGLAGRLAAELGAATPSVRRVLAEVRAA